MASLVKFKKTKESLEPKVAVTANKTKNKIKPRISLKAFKIRLRMGQ